MTSKPSVSLVAVAGRRKATLDLAQRLEQEGFGGIFCPSPGDGLALCEALALVTREVQLGTSIANIYTRHPFDYAQTAAVIHELSGGRFRFGIGVSHGPTHQRLGLKVGPARWRRRGSSSRTCAPPPSRWAACRPSCWPHCAAGW